MRIDALRVPLSETDLVQLTELLVDCVNGGGSMGFLRPLGVADARDHWLAAARGAEAGERVILVAREGPEGPIVGSAQLVPATQQNGRHRAEVQKVMVSSTHRRRGIARRLMAELETLARTRGVTLIVLDTAEGWSGARAFYESIGYTYAGGIPDFALDPDGAPTTNAIYYKALR